MAGNPRHGNDGRAARIVRAPGVRETTIRYLALGGTTAISVAFRDAVTGLDES